MNLNDAMVELYKKRGAAAASNKRRAEKRRKLVQEDESENIPRKEAEDKGELQSALDYQPSTTFDQLYGCDKAREQLIKIVNHHKRAIEGSDTKSERPILICGSRSLGKTSVVEAAANYAGLKLIPIALRTLVEQTRNGLNWNEFRIFLKLLEKHCLKNQPAIVLIDDLDRITDKEDLKLLVEGTISRLLASESRLLIFCTTVMQDSVSGMHFPFSIHLKRPDTKARQNILTSICKQNKNLMHLTTEDLRILAIKTPSFNAVDLKDMLYSARTESDGPPTLAHCEKAIDVVKQSFQRGTHLIGERPTVTWNDIGGLSEVREAFKDILEQIKEGDIDCKFAGIALYGPPGCGKTMVAQAMANEAGLNFISITPTELVDKFLGETEKNIRRVFSEAQEHEPCMIYFDEFDGLCGTRGNKDTLTGAIQTLLGEMDGFARRGKSIILVSTNRPEDIDPAIMRSGRLSKHIRVNPPDEKARSDILSVITSKSSLTLDKDLDIKFWAKKTEQFTGADLAFLVSEAKSLARKELDRSIESSANKIVLKNEHFESSMNKIRAINHELKKRVNTAKR